MPEGWHCCDRQYTEQHHAARRYLPRQRVGRRIVDHRNRQCGHGDDRNHRDRHGQYSCTSGPAQRGVVFPVGVTLVLIGPRLASVWTSTMTYQRVMPRFGLGPDCRAGVRGVRFACRHRPGSRVRPGGAACREFADRAENASACGRSFARPARGRSGTAAGHRARQARPAFQSPSRGCSAGIARPAPDARARFPQSRRSSSTPAAGAFPCKTRRGGFSLPIACLFTVSGGPSPCVRGVIRTVLDVPPL